MSRACRPTWLSHLALDLGARHEGGDRVDDDDVQGAGADQHVGDLERLLTGVRLGDQQRVGVDAQLLGVVRVERVLGIDERCDAPGGLRVGDRVQRDRRVVRQDPVGQEAVRVREHEVEGRLQAAVLNGDHLLVGLPGGGEAGEVVQQRSATGRQPVTAQLGPGHDADQPRAGAGQVHVGPEQVTRDAVELAVTAEVVPQVPHQARDVRDVLELRVPGGGARVARHLLRASG
jgi:hypothetical protein